MPPSRITKGKQYSAPKSVAKRTNRSMEQSPPRNNDTQGSKEYTGIPNSSSHAGGPILPVLPNRTLAFLFKSGTFDLAEAIKADQGPEIVTGETLLSTLEGCSKALSTLIDRHGFPTSLVAQMVDPIDQMHRERIARWFEQSYTGEIMDYLECQVAQLDADFRAGLIDVKDELKYAKLGKQILYASATIPCHDLDVDHAEWYRYSPKCVNQDIQIVLSRLDNTYHSFQQLVYLKLEASQDLKLWYLIWTNLKKTFILFTQCENSFPNDAYSVEEEFFTHPKTRSLFEWVTTQLDCLCPREIEDLVGRYIELVHRRSQQSRDVASYPRQNFQQILSSFPKEKEWNHEALVSLRSAAFEVSYLTRGPSLLRRLGRTVNHSLSEGDLSIEELQTMTAANDWMPIHETSRVNCTKSEELETSRLRTRGCFERTRCAKAPFVELNEAINDNSVGEELSDSEFVENQFLAELDEQNQLDEDSYDLSDDESPTDHTESAKLAAFRNYVPRGRNIISVYDYVYCPVPENRAYEVANSRLISRDLRTPGIVSDGLQTEDLVNLPPPHCRTPGSWTSWKQRIPLGPFEMFKILGSAVTDRVLGRSRAPVTRPLPAPYVTSREQCRPGNHKRKSKLNAKRDLRTRVTKSDAGQRVGLRGGGFVEFPRHVPPYDLSPTRPYQKKQGGKRVFVPNPHPRAPQRPRKATAGGSPGNQSPEYPNLDGENQPPVVTTAGGTERLMLGSLPAPTRDGAPSEPHKVAHGAGGNPGNGNTNLEYVSCHPCPIYKGQYHHICHGLCLNKVDAGLDKQFSETSLWEDIDFRLVRQADIATEVEFVELYNSTNISESTRTFQLSNGTGITVPRGEGMRHQVDNGPQVSHQASFDSFDASGIPQVNIMEDLPPHIVRIFSRIPSNPQWASVDLDDIRSIDDLLNSGWETHASFKITYSSRSSSREKIVIVQLERFRTSPWEVLQIMPVDQSPVSRHEQDYDTQSVNASTGAISEFQSSLERHKSANKKRQDDVSKQKRGDKETVDETEPVAQEPADKKATTDDGDGDGDKGDAEGTVAQKPVAKETPEPPRRSARVADAKKRADDEAAKLERRGGPKDDDDDDEDEKPPSKKAKTTTLKGRKQTKKKNGGARG